MTGMGALPTDHFVSSHALLALALGGSDDSFTGDLLRLIAKADPGNRARLRLAFPRHVAAWEVWMRRCPLTAGDLAAAIEGRSGGDG